LLEQSNHLVDWIKRFDPKTSEKMTMPPSLMGLHMFTDKMMDESTGVNQTAHFASTKRVSNDRYRNTKLWASHSNTKYFPSLTNDASRLSSMELTHFSPRMESEVKFRAEDIRKVSNSVLNPN
jgi:hypothetical protein